MEILISQSLTRIQGSEKLLPLFEKIMSFSAVFDRLNKNTFPTVRMNGAFQTDTGFLSQDAISRRNETDMIARRCQMDY